MLNSNTRRNVRLVVEAGYSIVEVVVAMGILAVSAVGVVYLLSQSTQSAFNNQSRLGSGNACINHANTLLSRIKDQGLNLAAASYMPAGSAAGNRNPQDEVGCPDGVACPGNDSIVTADRWGNTANDDILGTGNQPAARPAKLIVGIMNDLQAIYNTAPATYCGGVGADYNNILAAAAPQSSEFNLTGARLQVQPYNIDSLVLAGCPGGLFIAPPSAQAAPSAQNQIVAAGGAVNNLGLLTTITVDYTDRNGAAKSCFIQQRFQYEREPDAFPKMSGVINSTLANADNGGPQGYTCNRPSPNWGGGMQVSQTVSLSKEGSIVLCRNRSRRRGIAPAQGSRNVVLNLRGYWFDRHNRDTANQPAGAADVVASVDSFYIAGMTSGTMGINAASRVYCDPYFGCQHTFIAPTTGGNNSGIPGSAIAKTQADYPVGAVPEDPFNAAGVAPWVPCDTIADLTSQANAGANVCGGAADSTVTFGFDANNRTVQLDVAINNPGNVYGCDIAIDVVEVDAAYNISTDHVGGMDFYTIEDYLQQPSSGMKICHNNTGGALAGGGALVPSNQYYFFCGTDCPGEGGVVW